MLFEEVVETSAAVADTSARSAKVERLAECLRRCEPAEVGIAVAFLSGELRQRQIGVGYASLRDQPEPAVTASLTLTELDETFAPVGSLARAGSQPEPPP